MIVDAIRGGLAGGSATWLMDQVTTGMYASQSKATTAAELAAQPNGKGAVANLVDDIERALGLDLSDADKATAETAIHYGLGVIPGATYSVVAARAPRVALGSGLAFGFLLWLVNDEFLNTQLGLAGPFEKYPMQTHWRGFVGHAVLGVATDVGIRVLGGRTDR